MIIGVGIDVVEIDRFTEALNRYGQRMLNRLFTPEEQTYCQRFVRPESEYAVRFAAKEAFLKSIGTGKSKGIRWKDVEVCNEPSGKPTLRIRGRALEIASSLGINRYYVSLSHSRNIATAVVVVESI